MVYMYIFYLPFFFFPDSSGAILLNNPFQCCILPNFIHDPQSNYLEIATVPGKEEGFLLQLKKELLRLKFYEKNNDLYQFHQVSKISNAV